MIDFKELNAESKAMIAFRILNLYEYIFPQCHINILLLEIDGLLKKPEPSFNKKICVFHQFVFLVEHAQHIPGSLHVCSPIQTSVEYG